MSNRFRCGFLCLGSILLLSRLQVPAAEVDQDKTVRVVYLVSKDREVRTNYQQAVEHAIRELQGWYAHQLNGPTFKLHNPVVEVVRSSQAADWFYSHPNGDNQDDWGFNNTLAETSRLLGAHYNDPHYIWVIYSDGPGNKGRGGSGVTCLPEDDLLGLIGMHPTQKEPARWVGGLGHELGHAFGLPHPADTQRDADAIMWAGFYGKFPDKTYLTAEDKMTLLRSPFFFTTNGRSVADPVIVAIDPPEKDFFSKQLSFRGIPIKAPTAVSDNALYAAYERLGLLLEHLPVIVTNLVSAKVELHIIGKDQVTTDLPEWRQDKGKPLPEYNGLTRDQRTRGMGGRLVSCGEENLLKLEKDRYRGRDICLHEFAHAVRNFGISRQLRAKFDDQYHRSIGKDLWVKSYAASNPDEFFAELTMWYFGTHGDMNMPEPKPKNGPGGLKEYDPEAFALFEEFYQGRLSDEP